MICTFFGHRDAPYSITEKLCQFIEHLIVDRGIDTFYVGNNGNFDSAATAVLAKMQKKHPYIRCFTIVAYMPKPQDTFVFETIYPDSLETTPYRFAIAKRNEWMVRNSDYVICYVICNGGASKYKTMAEKLNKTVINLI